MITYDVNLCIGVESQGEKVVVKCHDTGVNLRVWLSVLHQKTWRAETEPYIIPDGATAILKIAKPDKTFVLVDGVVDGGYIFFAHRPEAFTAAGVSKAEVSLFDIDGNRLTTATFEIDVPEECVCDCKAESKTYVDIMAKQIGKVKEYAERAEASAKRAEEFTDTAILYDPQRLTEAQKAQTRENISATGTDLLADGLSALSLNEEYVSLLPEGGHAGGECLEVQGNPKNETVYLADRKLSAQEKAYRVRFWAKANNATHSLILSFTEFVRGVGYTRTEKFFPLSADWREYETTVIINEGRYSDYSHAVLTLYGRRVNDTAYMVISDLSLTELVEDDFCTHKELTDTVALAKGFAQRMPYTSGQFGISLKNTDGKSIAQAVMELPECGFYTAYVQKGCIGNPNSEVNSSFRGFVHLTNNDTEYDYGGHDGNSHQANRGYIVLFDEVGVMYVQYIKGNEARPWTMFKAPVKGMDYWTEEEQASIVQDVINGFGVYDGEVEGETGEVEQTNGKSAYEIAVDHGFEGTEEEWLASLKGSDGKDGYTPVKGVDYFDGEPGADGQDGVDGKDGVDGQDGKDGTSATHSWDGTTLIVTSASGTSSADLKGEKGDQGEQGIQGDKGDKGDKGDTGPAYTLTEADKAELVSAVIAEIPIYTGGTL